MAPNYQSQVAELVDMLAVLFGLTSDGFTCML